MGGNQVTKGDIKGSPCIVPNKECYLVTINDANHDGMCCDHGNGGYAVIWNDALLVMSDGRFKRGEQTMICNPAVRPKKDNICMRLEFSADEEYPDDISWELVDENKKLVAKGGYLGNRCIYLKKSCYTLVVSDEFGDGNA